jgi:hypothetical protein
MELVLTDNDRPCRAISMFGEKWCLPSLVGCRCLLIQCLSRRLLLILLPGWVALCCVVQGCSGKSNNTAPDELRCRYGTLAVALPRGWSCSENVKNKRVHFILDESSELVAILVSLPSPLRPDEDSKDKWLSRVRDESKELSGKYGAIQGPSYHSQGNATLYYIEGFLRAKKFKNSVRREGYIVGKVSFAKFVEIRPESIGEPSGNTKLAEFWNSVDLE